MTAQTLRPHRLLTAAACALALLGGGRDARAQGWKVVCSDALFDELRRGGEWQTDAQCDDTRSDGLTAPVRTTLEGATNWLEGLGFEPPDARRQDGDGPFVAVVFAPEERRCRGREACFTLPGRLVQTPESYVQGAERVLVHELFHAVQLAHVGPAFFQVIGDPADPDSRAVLGWISEGTAEAVGLQWARGPASRRYDVSLTEAPGREEHYDAAHFWLSAGELLDAVDRVAHTKAVLDRLAEDPGLEFHGIPAVDAAFRGLGAEGFDQVFVDVVARRANDPSLYEAVEEVGIRYAPREVVERVGGTVEPVAADAWRVTASVPPGRTAALRVEIVDRLDDLRLVVDGERYDEPDGSEDRNVFHAVLDGRAVPHSFLVRVANVAHDALWTERRTYGLEVALSPVEVVARVRGDVRARLTGGALFSYLNLSMGAGATVANTRESLIDRFADMAGLDEDTPEGRRARAQIRAAADAALEAQGIDPDVEEWVPTEEPRCVVLVTIHDDASRSLVRLRWEGTGPFLGATHSIGASYAHQVSPGAYEQMRDLGQAVAIVEDPTLLARSGLGAGSLLAGLSAGAARRDPGRLYDDEGRGTLRMEPRDGGAVRGSFDFTAERIVDRRSQGTVQVEGEFTALPGPLVSEHLRHGCEREREP